MLNEPRFQEALTTWRMGRPLMQRKSVDSTNRLLKRQPIEQLPHGLLLLAEHQSHGRGQKHRRWHSETGENLTFSLALRPSDPTCRKRIPLLSLLAGLAVIRALEVETPGSMWNIKWPNDVLVEGKKLAGILTEVTFRGSRIERIILGMGINVNQTRFESEHGAATSLKVITGRQIVREPILARIVNELEPLYNRWQQADDALPSEINRRLRGVGEFVQVQVDKKKLSDPLKFLGADLQGHLHFLTNDMTLTTFRHEQIRIDPLS
ncbi:MAG: biotin--[acetyl-CoA-carboxylase] ligase [Balneolaceae bacterium]